MSTCDKQKNVANIVSRVIGHASIGIAVDAAFFCCHE